MSDPVVCPKCKHQMQPGLAHCPYCRAQLRSLERGAEQLLPDGSVLRPVSLVADQTEAKVEYNPARGRAQVAGAVSCFVVAFVFPRIAKGIPALTSLDPGHVQFVVVGMGVLLAFLAMSSLARPVDWRGLAAGLGGELVEADGRTEMQIPAGDWWLTLEEIEHVSRHPSGTTASQRAPAITTHTRMHVLYQEREETPFGKEALFLLCPRVW